MRIGGFQKCSLIDYPGKICAIVFTLGCNFRCSYCHNPELVYPELFNKPIPEEEIFSFLTRRRGKLDAVTITGGEPTLQADLLDFILKIKKLGFLVKLDTNGSNPEIMENVISSKSVDYIAMDVKAPLEKYQEITDFTIEPERIKKTIELIMNSNIDYEFRTTIVKSELDENDISKIGELIKGAKLCVLQKYVSPGKNTPERRGGTRPHLTSKLVHSGQPQGSFLYSDEEFRKFQGIMAKCVQKCTIR